jgi:hypothetical protein
VKNRELICFEFKVTEANTNFMVMNKFKTQTILFISLLFLGIMFSCEDPNAPDYEYFMIKVDSIQIPEIILANETFEIQLFGLIANSGCSQFSEFKTGKQGENIIIEAWGKRNKNAVVCPGVEVYLQKEKLLYRISEKGKYTLKIKQPDGTFLMKEILVE